MRVRAAIALAAPLAFGVLFILAVAAIGIPTVLFLLAEKGWRDLVEYLRDRDRDF